MGSVAYGQVGSTAKPAGTDTNAEGKRCSGEKSCFYSAAVVRSSTGVVPRNQGVG
jgi:hypothetical protein